MAKGSQQTKQLSSSSAGGWGELLIEFKPMFSRNLAGNNEGLNLIREKWIKITEKSETLTEPLCPKAF